MNPATCANGPHLEGLAAIACINANDEEAEQLAHKGWTPVQRCDMCEENWDDLTAALAVAATWGDADVHITIEGQPLVRRADHRKA